jgi:hypothetical protein
MEDCVIGVYNLSSLFLLSLLLGIDKYSKDLRLL